MSGKIRCFAVLGVMLACSLAVAAEVEEVESVNHKEPTKLKSDKAATPIPAKVDLASLQASTIEEEGLPDYPDYGGSADRDNYDSCDIGGCGDCDSGGCDSGGCGDCDSGGCGGGGCGDCDCSGCGCGGGYAAAFAPCDCTPGVVFYVDWLSWKLRYDTKYATSSTSVSGGTSRREQYVCTPRDHGIRVGLGYHFASCWDVTWNYTYFHTHASASSSAHGAGETLRLTGETPYLAPNSNLVNTAKMTGSFDYDVNDIEFGHRFCIDDRATARIFGGFRWAMIDTDLDLRYTYTRRYPAVGEAVGTERDALDQDAYGIRMGAEGRWYVTPRLSLFGRGAGSVLVRRRTLRQWETNDGTTYYSVGTSTGAATAVDVAAGISWTRGRWELSGAYELTAWQNILGNESSSDLVLDGFVLRLALNR